MKVRSKPVIPMETLSCWFRGKTGGSLVTSIGIEKMVLWRYMKYGALRMTKVLER